jgi:hypothetical protein
MPIDLKKNDAKIDFVQYVSNIVQNHFMAVCHNQYGVIIAKQLV